VFVPSPSTTSSHCLEKTFGNDECPVSVMLLSFSPTSRRAAPAGIVARRSLIRPANPQKLRSQGKAIYVLPKLLVMIHDWFSFQLIVMWYAVQNPRHAGTGFASCRGRPNRLQLKP
jgi:hypothetical protein